MSGLAGMLLFKGGAPTTAEGGSDEKIARSATELTELIGEAHTGNAGLGFEFDVGNAKSGVRVVETFRITALWPTGFTSEAGLAVGDEIFAVHGRFFDDADTIIASVADRFRGDEIEVAFFDPDDGGQYTTRLRLAERVPGEATAYIDPFDQGYHGLFTLFWEQSWPWHPYVLPDKLQTRLGERENTGPKGSMVGRDVRGLVALIDPGGDSADEKLQTISTYSAFIRGRIAAGVPDYLGHPLLMSYLAEGDQTGLWSWDPFYIGDMFNLDCPDASVPGFGGRDECICIERPAEDENSAPTAECHYSLLPDTHYRQALVCFMLLHEDIPTFPGNPGLMALKHFGQDSAAVAVDETRKLARAGYVPEGLRNDDDRDAYAMRWMHQIRHLADEGVAFIGGISVDCMKKFPSSENIPFPTNEAEAEITMIVTLSPPYITERLLPLPWQ